MEISFSFCVFFLASKKAKIAPGIWEQIKAWIQIPTPAWVNLASVAAAFALGLYMMKPISQQILEKPEIDIKELLRSGQLGQIKFAENGHKWWLKILRSRKSLSIML